MFVTWCLEVAPAVIGGVVLWFTRERFPLTTLVYVLILIHCIILMIGGHYTYAEVPLGEWVRELVDGSRNNYDKLGHFVQGFIPAIITRELMIRLEVFNSSRWRDFFIVCFCCYPKKPPTRFSAHRATSGIRNPTWGGHSSVQCWPSFCSADFTTDSCVNAASFQRSEHR
jgi:hypothetical protein